MSILEAQGVRFAYAKGTPVLNDFDLRVEGGERVALRAPSGRGKSTACQLLAGYLEPQAGRILMDGAPIDRRAGRPDPVQLIWQHPEQALDPYLRIRRSLREAGELPSALLEGLGIRVEWLDRFPHELSGGELQRCCLARALAVGPRFVIADEVSTMLDAITQVQILGFLVDFCARTDAGLLLVTHSRELTERLATRVVDLG